MPFTKGHKCLNTGRTWFKKGSKVNLNRKQTKKQKLKISKNRKGKCMGSNNGAWNNGSSFEPYGLEFNNQLKEYIRNKYNYRCQECFRHQDELGYKLHVHHINFNKKNNNSNNLIPLCRSCHAQTNFNRQNWTQYYQNKLWGGL